MKSLFGAVAVAALLVATPTFAQGFGQETYINLGYTNFALDEIAGEEIDEEVDFNLGAVTGRIGTKFTPNFGVEGELNIGVKEEEASDAFTTISTKLNYGAAAFLVGYLPVSPNAELFARAGVGVTELETEIEEAGFSDSESGSETVFGLGVGGQYFFDGLNGVRGEYTRYTGENESAEFDALSVSYVRKF